jgi:hypothetical protein
MADDSGAQRGLLHIAHCTGGAGARRARHYWILDTGVLGAGSASTWYAVYPPPPPPAPAPPAPRPSWRLAAGGWQLAGVAVRCVLAGVWGVGRVGVVVGGSVRSAPPRTPHCWLLRTPHSALLLLRTPRRAAAAAHYEIRKRRGRPCFMQAQKASRPRPRHSPPPASPPAALLRGNK